MDDFSMDWDQEIQDMVDDLLLDALVLELCRLAAAQAPSSLTRFPGLVDRCGDHLSQHAFGLQMWSRELAAPVRGGSPTSPG